MWGGVCEGWRKAGAMVLGRACCAVVAGVVGVGAWAGGACAQVSLAAGLTGEAMAAEVSASGGVEGEAVGVGVDGGVAAGDEVSGVEDGLGAGDGLGAVVLGVEGTAQVRVGGAAAGAGVAGDGGDGGWVALEVGMALGEGAEIRTGVRSFVVMRVGVNATVRVNSLSRVSLDAVGASGVGGVREALLALASGDAGAGAGLTLRTRLRLGAGDVDVRVDHLGEAANDFAVETAEGTLAVRGTRFSAGVDALSGLRVQGASTNGMRAMELAYLDGEGGLGGVVAFGRGGVEGGVRDPALLGLMLAARGDGVGVVAEDFGERIGRRVSVGGVGVASGGGLRPGGAAESAVSAVRERITEVLERGGVGG